MSNEFFTSNLNYAMANEDAQVERDIALLNNPSKILSVCGSGIRAYPLVTAETLQLDLIDLSAIQIAWARMRLKTLISLNYEEYLNFWGYEELNPKKRKEDYEDFIKDIDPRLIKIFSENNWKSPITFGSWEKTYHKLYKIVSVLVGKKLLSQFAKTQNLDEQIKIYNSYAFKTRWHAALHIVGAKALFNSLMYKGGFVKKNIPESTTKFYQNAFQRLVEKVHIKKSFFLQLSFMGKVLGRESLPCESQKEVFTELRSLLPQIQVNFLEKNIMDYLAVTTETYDLISLSDVPSYFDDYLGNNFLQHLKNATTIGGVVIVRYYLRAYRPKLDNFEDVTSDYASIIQDEKVQMYDIKVYKRVS